MNLKRLALVGLFVSAFAFVPIANASAVNNLRHGSPVALDGTSPVPPGAVLDGTSPVPHGGVFDGTSPVPRGGAFDGCTPVPPGAVF